MQFETRFIKNQRAAREGYNNRGKVIWRSCEIVDVSTEEDDGPVYAKQSIKGTMRLKRGVRGKAIKKRIKKLNHKRHYYASQRSK